MQHKYQIGDRVVYIRDKYTSRPTANAKNVSAERKGESYHYQVEKFWVVCGVLAGGRVEVCTRRGQRYIVQSDDVRLRPATLIERLIKGRFFPKLTAFGPEGRALHSERRTVP